MNKKMINNRIYKNQIIYKIIAILSVICIIFSVLIYIEKAKYSSSQDTFCSAITGTNGCETVQTSKYGQIKGIDNAIFGIIGFSALGIISFLLTRKKTMVETLAILTIIGGIIAGIVSLIFIYLQMFVLNAYCLFCLIVDISSLAILGLVTYLLIRRIKQVR